MFKDKNYRATPPSNDSDPTGRVGTLFQLSPSSLFQLSPSTIFLLLALCFFIEAQCQLKLYRISRWMNEEISPTSA